MEQLTIGNVIEHCDRQCERYKNFSQHIENCQNYLLENNKYYAEHYYVKEWLQELQHYKDLEEQGLLLKLPCKVGETFFKIICDNVIYELRLNKIMKSKVVKGEYTYCCNVVDREWDVRYIESTDKLIFITKEEAEKALAEMENNK